VNRIRPGRCAAALFAPLGGLFVAGLLIACEPRRSEPSLPPSFSFASLRLAPALLRVALADSEGVARSPIAQATRPSAPPGSMGGRAVSAADVEFVSAAASAATLEIEASRVALERTKIPAVRNFAQRMSDDHARIGSELRGLNVATSVGNLAAINPMGSDQLRKLKELQGREFDREYVAQIGVAAHDGAIGAFENAASATTDAQVRTFAQAKLPELREHLKLAQAVAREVRAPSAHAKSDPLASGAAK
jgi:putative membrane protein